MKLEIHHVHHHEFEPLMRDRLLAIQRELQMISTEVQNVLDRARTNNNLVASVDLGMKALAKQVADLQAQIGALPVGNVLSDEDKTALVEAATDLDTSISTLQSDIPANTPQGATTTATQGAIGASTASNPGNAPAAAPSPVSPPPSTDPAAPATAPSDASAHQADSDAASQAKPLAGTSPAS